jgi:Outer membrane protein beta-barrel domain
MKSIWMATLGTMLVIVCGSTLLSAQEYDFDENSRLNTNIAVPVVVPVNPTARFTNFGVGFTAGAGYNMSPRNAFVGEFMWNRLFPSNSAITPLRLALHSRSLKGYGNLIAFTGNYKFELRGKSLGTYFIGGGGFYYRSVTLSQEVVTGTTIACTPEWVFWGFVCSSGVVSSDQTLASTSSAAPGFNAGMGFTIKVGEPRYRLYFEARYHYAATTPANTQLIPITFGIRF